MGQFALLVGISKYKDEGLSALPSADKDVAAIKRVLQHPKNGYFNESDITVLVNENREQIEREIYTLFDERNKDDLLFFYFSGHGITDERGDFYLSAHSTEKRNGKLLPTSAISAKFFHSMMEESNSKRQVIILDCCFSGAFAKGMTAKDGGQVNIFRQLEGTGRAILTASNSTQYAFEQKGFDLSLYTHFLVEALEKGAADDNGDGYISVDELHGYIKNKVREVNNSMTPEFYPVKEGHKIILAKSPKDDPKLKFRQEFESFAKDRQGKFDNFDNKLKEEMRKKWNLKLEEAEEIENEILRPYREYDRKLEEYEQALIIEASESGIDVLSKNAQAKRKEYWKYIGLREEDVISIENKILSPLKARNCSNQDESHTKQEEYEAKLEQYRQELTKAVQAEYPLNQYVIENLKKFQSRLELKDADIIQVEQSIYELTKAKSQETIEQKAEVNQQQNIDSQRRRVFEFDVIAVNKKGIETNRTRRTAEFFAEDLGNSVLLEMINIPSGTFQMGSPKDQGNAAEKPQHSVTVSTLFMGKFPITQAQWRIVTGLPRVNVHLDPEPANFKGDNRPVEQVSWYEAMEFCDRLSRKTGRTYRLPTEAEWEHACRAGTTTPFHFGEALPQGFTNCNTGNAITFYTKALSGSTVNVGSFNFANEFGLYDMHGNVWEWCLDHWHSNYQNAPSNGKAWISKDAEQPRVLRGGAWDYSPHDCRSASRIRYIPGFRLNVIGFRVVAKQLE